MLIFKNFNIYTCFFVICWLLPRLWSLDNKCTSPSMLHFWCLVCMKLWSRNLLKCGPPSFRLWLGWRKLGYLLYHTNREKAKKHNQFIQLLINCFQVIFKTFWQPQKVTIFKIIRVEHAGQDWILSTILHVPLEWVRLEFLCVHWQTNSQQLCL